MNSTQDTAEARLYWNGNESLNLGLGGGNVTISLGQEVINYVTNAEATTLNVGEVVYLFGAQGDRPSVKRASNTSDTTSSKTFGIVAETITAGGAGFVVNKGICGKINTAAYNEGDVLWLSSTPGQFTKTKPVAPEHLVFVGVVLRTNAGNGLVYVAPQNGYELDEIHDVLITSATNGDFLVYESSTDLWKNKQITATDPVNYDAATQVISIDDASTSAKGAVQLTSLTNSTSEVLAATAKGLKDAYDVAAGAIPKSIIDNEGDLIVGASDDNPGKLGVGSNGYVLTVDTTVAGKIAWKAASGGAVNVTSPITNSGTSTNPIIGIDDASTTQKGAVQLSSSTDSTSEVLAATPLAVKTAYDQGSQGISD
ncbi:MAG: phage tail protein, partial [Candidatus Nanopelagicaceae bacterium]